MSSYLTFYVVPKEEGAKPISLISYSRNSEIYQYFNDNIGIAYIGMEEPQYTELTSDKVRFVLDDVIRDISRAEKRVFEYEKHAAGNSEIIDEILSLKEYLETLYYCRSRIEFIQEIVEDVKYNDDLKAIYCNVD
jgi:hypothetical protein